MDSRARAAKTRRANAPKITNKAWFVIVMLSLVGQVAWAVENNFFNLFIQDAFGASLSDVALMVSASAVTATATTLFAGAWSDRTGRRKPFVVVGTLLWGASILVFSSLQQISSALAKDVVAAASLGITLTIVFDCVMTFFGSLANDSAFNAWVTDITDETNRGAVEGVNSAMPLIAMLAVFGGAMFLMAVSEDGTVTYDYALFFEIIGFVVLASAAVTGFLMDESSPEPSDAGVLRGLAYGFLPSTVRANPRLYQVLAAYCVFSIATQVFMPYYVLYLRLPYILGEGYVLVMAPCIILAAVFTIVYGRVVDKRGFVGSVFVPLALFVVGNAVLGLLAHPVAVFVGSALMLCGYLGSIACFAAEVRNNTPAGHVGLLQGIRIIAVVLVPMLVGPWIGSTISASSGAVVGFGVVGDGFTPSSLVFLGGAVVAVVSALLVRTLLAKPAR